MSETFELSQLPQDGNISMVAGDDYAFGMFFYIGTISTPLNLTDYVFHCEAQAADGTAIIIPVTVTIPATSGRITVVISAALSETLNGLYDWYLWWVDALTKKRTLSSGVLKVARRG